MKHAQLILLIFSIATALQSMDKPKDKKPKKRNIISHALDLVQKDKSKKNLASPEIVIGEPITQLLFNNDALTLITNYLCRNTKRTKNACKAIIRLSRVCRSLYHYYSREDLIKHIINRIAIAHHKSDLYVADYLNRSIHTKMCKLMWKINQGECFTEDDLQDPWYLNVTFSQRLIQKKTYRTPADDIAYCTLLLQAVFCCDIANTAILLNANAPCLHPRCPSPIALLAIPNSHYELTTERIKKIAILELLFKANVHPDSRFALTFPTLLHQAAEKRDKEFALFLLKNGANPHTLYFNDNYGNRFDPDTGEVTQRSVPALQEFKATAQTLPLNTLYLEADNSTEPWKQNAFHMEQGQPKGWLKTIHDEINRPKLNLVIEQACERVSLKS
jgi:hypothetical protein